MASAVSGIISGILGGNAAKKGGQIINQADQAAENGVLASTKNAQDAINNQLGTNVANVNTAGGTAIGDVNQGAGAANHTLQGTEGNIGSTLNPYLNGGAQGATSLAKYAASNPQFSFSETPQQIQNTPGYQAQLYGGTTAIDNSASAQGLANSGATLQALTQYGQNLAGTYYNNAFNQALQGFQTNQNTTLSNLGALTNTGLDASGQMNQANTFLGSQQAQNTMGAGIYGGQTTTGLAQYLASQGMQGQALAGQEGMQGSMDAGNFGIQGATARAQGIAGAAAGYGGAINSAMTGSPGSPSLASSVWQNTPTFSGSNTMGQILGFPAEVAA